MDTTKTLQLIGYSSDVPTIDGWYHVIMCDRELPQLLYLRFVDGRVLWGWDVEDDPEFIGEDEQLGMLFKKASHGRN